MSTYELLGWPIQITVTPFTVAIIAAVAPYLAGTKMGSWEIPEVTDRLNRILQFAGPVFLASILFGYFPFWSKADSFDLGDYNAGAFQISNKKMTVDLSLRRQVGQETRKKVRVSPAKWGTTLKIRKSANAPDRFFKEFWTSGLPPDVHCFSHPFEFEELPYVPSSGRENMRRYGLFVDITDEEPNVEFVIRYQYLFWNSFQGQTEEWAAAPIKHATDKLTFSVFSPRDKPFKSHDLYFYPTINPDLEKFTDTPDFDFSPEQMAWRIEKPKINHSYRIIWEW